MKKSFTMIELIITIVVMAIAMMTVPLILAQVMKSEEFSLNQEALLAGATKIGNVMTYQWDEKNVGELDLKHVLDVAGGDSELNRWPDANSTLRIGHFEGEDRRKFFSTILSASTIGIDDSNETNFPDDIDDFNGRTNTLVVNSASDSDYVKSFTLTTTVKYVSDSADYSQSTVSFDFSTSGAATTTNIKMIEVKITDNLNNEEIAAFRSFATNIGGYKLLQRTFN
ncbi:type II secretion system protein [Nitrosophilus alvini]|uniref:type II secretion system protein n=1 Tax=Nitrosophilus alvini TaxID=2714855 RepID=UPI00190C1462|nr:type II secretion system protein [Nitrosophilus alvini]